MSVADAVRIRDALDPLLVQDAARHRSARDLEELVQGLRRMQDAAAALDGHEFLRANWALHDRMARISPSVMLRSVYRSLLEMIESHTLAVQSVDDDQPLPDYFEDRYRLHADLVAAIAAQDEARALELLKEHNAPARTTSAPAKAAGPPAKAAKEPASTAREPAR
jgi:DNA-binding GntR family transcriptional regulator